MRLIRVCLQLFLFGAFVFCLAFSFFFESISVSLLEFTTSSSPRSFFGVSSHRDALSSQSKTYLLPFILPSLPFGLKQDMLHENLKLLQGSARIKKASLREAIKNLRTERNIILRQLYLKVFLPTFFVSFMLFLLFLAYSTRNERIRTVYTCSTLDEA